MKVNSMADALHLTPFRTTTNDDSIEYSFYTLVNKSTMQTLSQLGVLDKSLLSHIKTHTDKESTEEIALIIDVNRLDFYNFLLFTRIMDPYCPITKEIERNLNENCNLKKATNLFTGSLLYIENTVIAAIF